VNRRKNKVEETAASYAAKPPAKTAAAAPKPAEPGVRTVDDATFKKISDRIFSERKELLHKLAQ
jgi:hypothetical protein